MTPPPRSLRSHLSRSVFAAAAVALATLAAAPPAHAGSATARQIAEKIVARRAETTEALAHLAEDTTIRAALANSQDGVLLGRRRYKTGPWTYDEEIWVTKDGVERRGVAELGGRRESLLARGLAPESVRALLGQGPDLSRPDGTRLLRAQDIHRELTFHLRRLNR